MCIFVFVGLEIDANIQIIFYFVIFYLGAVFSNGYSFLVLGITLPSVDKNVHKVGWDLLVINFSQF